MNEVLFKETQRFSSQWWIWLIILLGPTVVFLTDYPTGIEKGDWLGILIPGVLAALIILPMKLETEIRMDGLYFSFPVFIFKQKRIGWENVSRAYVRKYSPLGEYGGWGLRGLGRNRAYNISGNMGIQLILNDGRKVLFGTQNPEQAQMALERIGFKPPLF